MSYAAPDRRIIPGPGARASFARAISDIQIGDPVAVSTDGGLYRGTVQKFYGRAGVLISRTEEGVEGQTEYLKVEHLRYIEPEAEFVARFSNEVR